MLQINPLSIDASFSKIYWLLNETSSRFIDFTKALLNSEIAKGIIYFCRRCKYTNDELWINNFVSFSYIRSFISLHRLLTNHAHINTTNTKHSISICEFYIDTISPYQHIYQIFYINILFLSLTYHALINITNIKHSIWIILLRYWYTDLMITQLLSKKLY